MLHLGSSLKDKDTLTKLDLVRNNIGDEVKDKFHLLKWVKTRELRIGF